MGTSTTETGAGTSALVKALRAAVTKAIPGTEFKPNAAGNYERLLLNGKSYALIFAPGAKGVATKIPKHLIDVKLPSGHGFKKGKWGLTKTITSEDEVGGIVEAFMVAAVTQKERTAAKAPAPKAAPRAVPEQASDEGPAVTPNSRVVRRGSAQATPDPKPLAKAASRTTGKRTGRRRTAKK